MSRDLESCKAILESEKLTCVVAQGEKIFKATERGIKPFMKWIESDEDFKGAVAADRVVGKAAAFLMVKVGLQAVYAAILSEPAEAILKNAGIAYFYGQLVPRIQNRAGTGLCPMESAVMDIENAEEAYARLRIKLAEMSSKQSSQNN